MKKTPKKSHAPKKLHKQEIPQKLQKTPKKLHEQIHYHVNRLPVFVAMYHVIIGIFFILRMANGSYFEVMNDIRTVFSSSLSYILFAFDLVFIGALFLAAYLFTKEKTIAYYLSLMISLVLIMTLSPLGILAIANIAVLHYVKPELK